MLLNYSSVNVQPYFPMSYSTVYKSTTQIYTLMFMSKLSILSMYSFHTLKYGTHTTLSSKSCAMMLKVKNNITSFKKLMKTTVDTMNLSLLFLSPFTVHSMFLLLMFPMLMVTDPSLADTLTDTTSGTQSVAPSSTYSQEALNDLRQMLQTVNHSAPNSLPNNHELSNINSLHSTESLSTLPNAPQNSDASTGSVNSTYILNDNINQPDTMYNGNDSTFLSVSPYNSNSLINLPNPTYIEEPLTSFRELPQDSNTNINPLSTPGESSYSITMQPPSSGMNSHALTDLVEGEIVPPINSLQEQNVMSYVSNSTQTPATSYSPHSMKIICKVAPVIITLGLLSCAVGYFVHWLK